MKDLTQIKLNSRGRTTVYKTVIKNGLNLFSPLIPPRGEVTQLPDITLKDSNEIQNHVKTPKLTFNIKQQVDLVEVWTDTEIMELMLILITRNSGYCVIPAPGKTIW